VAGKPRDAAVNYNSYRVRGQLFVLFDTSRAVDRPHLCAKVNFTKICHKKTLNLA